MTRIVSATFFAARSISPMPAISRCSSTRSRSRRCEREMAERGYLDGRKMANAFNLLRSNDLIWPYVINNYLKGKEPPPFDLLYWNADATRMPAANHSFYLRNCYLENMLAQRRDGDRRQEARSQEGEDADLQSRHARGPHRAGEVGDARLEILRRPGALRARGLRPHRRRGQSARQEEVPVLDRPQAEPAPTSTSGSPGHRASRLVVAGLARLAQEARTRPKFPRASRAAASSSRSRTRREVM